ncbi:hypothetical protein STVIR_8123 [Streptomyces viridochromogenes Tue57]|uniref:Uncharacterized protein n=1 Tax=Streptomyces viridochromogenes Tue57 TaxID=1160705 RepID=L8P342_STRVR|nr:hypothetical protein STVIR_8123 [Streptomyces viridochromogenes Tue57]
MARAAAHVVALVAFLGPGLSPHTITSSRRTRSCGGNVGASVSVVYALEPLVRSSM